jgi:magnesium chelatase family protein
LAEFPREVLEVLRQPLEDKEITISRAQWSVSYPAWFMFVATMNPCKCWYYKDEFKACSCSLHEIKKYQSKISWPLLDRFDIILEVPRETIDVILEKQNNIEENNEYIWVEKARKTQTNRYQKSRYWLNAHVSWADVQKFISLSTDAELFLKNAIKQLALSPRVMHRVMKVARTIADIWWYDSVSQSHIAEALQYRSKSMLVNI